MAKIHLIIDELFGGLIDEQGLLEAFRLEHPGFVSRAIASAEDGKAVFVHGDFHTSSADCAYAGRFERALSRTGSDVVAEHRSIVVEERFRKQGIAKSHYTKLIRFYDDVGVEYIRLEAVGYGPVVWPQFGFELREPEDRALLDRLYREVVEELGYEVEEVPKQAALLALTPAIEGVDIGLEALGRLYESLGRRPIPMILDLKSEPTRAFLRFRGILEMKGEAGDAQDK